MGDMPSRIEQIRARHEAITEPIWRELTDVGQLLVALNAAQDALRAIALGVARGNRGHDETWGEIARAALAGREPEGTAALSWLRAARRVSEGGSGDGAATSS